MNKGSGSIYWMTLTDKEIDMKHRMIITIGLLIGFSASAAMAGSTTVSRQDNVNLGLVSMPALEFAQLKNLVSGGKSIPTTASTAPSIMETAGLVDLTAQEVAVLRKMVTGDYVTVENIAPAGGNPMIELGLVDMHRSEFEALRSMVKPYRITWDAVLAGSATGHGASAGK